MKRTGPMHIGLQSLIEHLRGLSKKENAKIWKRVAHDLLKPTRQRRAVNISRISRYTKKNDVIVVPGKVLGDGELLHTVKVAAWQFSEKAQEKLGKNAVSITELIKENPKGKGVKIIG